MATRANATTLTYLAWNTNTNAYQTGDAANHTLRKIKDGVEATCTNSPAEADAVNAKGAYTIAMTSTECDCFCLWVGGVSSTANVVLIPVQIGFDLTGASIATAIWQDSTAGDFTVNSSIGKSLYTSGNAPGTASGLTLVSSLATLAQIANAVWTDSVAGDFTVANSAGISLFTGVAPGAVGGLAIPGSFMNQIRRGTAQAGSTSTTLVLDAGASATTGAYVGQQVSIIGGTGASIETKLITAYNTGTKTVTVDTAWATTPDNTSIFVIQPWSGVVVTTNNDKTGYVLSSTGVFNVWDIATSLLVDAGSIGLLAVTGLNRLSGDAYALLTSAGTALSAAPSATATPIQQLEWTFMLARNKVTTTATTSTLFADDSATSVSTSAVSDDGTTFTRAKWV